MKNKIKSAIAIVSILVTALAPCLPASACSFSTDVYFTFTNHPDFPLRKYAAGELGIIEPTYARSYLLCAYRYLSDKPLTADEQKGFVDLWDKRMTTSDPACPSDTSSWLKLRNSVPGTPKKDEIQTERPVKDSDSYQSFCNCQTDAFMSATKTLTELIKKYGASSDTVSQWLLAQDMVFSNCGFPSWEPLPPNIPPELPANAEEILKKQRQYQIAAANFYATNFDTSRKQFEEIAGDTSSPWNHIAGYLAVRAMIRQASMPKSIDNALLAEAQKRIDHMKADPSYAGLVTEMTLLTNYIAARLDPIHHIESLLQEKISKTTAEEITSTLDRMLPDTIDTEGIKYNSVPPGLKAIDSIDWIVTMQCDDPDSNHAFERWKQTHSTAWLVAAIATVNADNPNAKVVLKAAESNQSSFAKLTMQYHQARLLAGMDPDKAITLIDKVLAPSKETNSISALNRFKTLRLMLSQDLHDFVKYGIQNPASDITSGGVDQVPDNVAQLEKAITSPHEEPIFTREAGWLLDTQFPISVLITLAGDKSIPTKLRAHINWESWVRAALLGDDAHAATLATMMKPYNKAKAKLIDAYLSAKTPEDKKFAAAFLMLQFSSADPNIGWGLINPDTYGDEAGWWWGDKPINHFSEEPSDTIGDIDDFRPDYLTTAQKTALKAELAKLGKTAAAPDYFANTVLAYARSHSSDERVPQALSLVVKSTRYGASDKVTSALSKQAFQVLHTKYKTSPWAKKTPYYY